VLIVDDERPARAKLRRLVAQQSGVSAIEEAADGIEALRAVEAFRPDLMLLDIQMPEVGGLELAASLPEPAPLIVFVTAHDAHALRAFELGAADYLLKPYDEARVVQALQRARVRLQGRGDDGGTSASGHGAPASIARTPLPAPARLLVKDGEALRVVAVRDVDWLEAAGNYVVLHTGRSKPMLRRTLQALVEQLGPPFVRVHRGHAVNVERVESVVPLFKGDCELVLAGGARVPCSRQYRDALHASLGIAPDDP
jgi:two-component system LytT family response regulator